MLIFLIHAYVSSYTFTAITTIYKFIDMRDKKNRMAKGEKHGIWNEMIHTVLELATQKTCDF